jgi:hypothetical protein
VGGLREAVAAVKETNRVLGLERLLAELRGSGRSALAVLSELRQGTAEARDCPYVVCGLD